MIQKTYVILRDFSRQMGKQNISAFAASTAFFLFLSMVPMLMTISTILPYTPLTEENLVHAVTEITPDKIDPLIEGMIADVYGNSRGILSIALITTLWSAGKGVLALMRGLNAINGVVEQRNYFVVRLVSSFYTVVLLLGIVISLLIMVFGNQLLDFIIYSIPQIQVVISFLMNFRFIFVWLILTILFSTVYAYVPNGKLSFKEQLPGASFSAIAWSVFSWGFSFYIGGTQAYSIYGSLSIIIVIMIWMYMCMYIIMIGAYLNRYFRPINRVLLGTHK